MSGEKCSKIKVKNRTKLFVAWRDASRKRARREEARRQEQAAQRAREREAIEGARGRLAVLETEFESLRARASEMQKNMAPVELPAEPTLPEVDENDTGAILESLSRIESTIAEYRSGLNASMLRFSRDRAQGMGRDEVLDWYGSFVATPADAALMMQLGSDGVFVGSGVFKSGDPVERGRAIVEAVTHFNDPAIIAEVSRGLGEPMVGLEIGTLREEQLLSTRGW